MAKGAMVLPRQSWKAESLVYFCLHITVHSLHLLQVVEAARQDGWQPNFDPSDMTAARIERLAATIDSTFLHGSFTKACHPRYLVKDELSNQTQGLTASDICGAVAGFEQDSNTLIVFRKGWSKQPSLEKPGVSSAAACSDVKAVPAC